MEEVKVKFIEKIQRTPSVVSFRFLPYKKINFAPGQFLQIIFDEKNKDNRELNKYLSFSCQPQKEYIEVTKRLSESEFSKTLNSLTKSKEISVRGPIGNIVFKDEMKNIAFLIGGIGITPVISILEYICEKKLGTSAFVFYSNRTEEEIAFRKELDLLCNSNSNIRVVYTVTDCAPKDDICVQGVIDKNLIEAKTIDLSRRTVFIYGPPGMVTSMKGMCFDLGCEKDNVQVESFIGY